MTALFGPSGSGKTTLLRAIAGLDRHAGGVLRVGGETWQEPGLFVPPHRRDIGYVFQEASLFEHLTVRRNLEYAARRVPPGGRRVAPERAIELLGIAPLLERRPATLSGGERRRVAIARALAASPRLLLMDEPLAGLEVARRLEILPHIEALHGELALPVIYVSHSPAEVARIADRIVLLVEGRVIAHGAAHELLTRLDLPLARGRDAESLIEATVSAHDETYGLTRLDFAGGSFVVPRRAIEAGRRVRLRLAARDVSLAIERPSGTSIMNVFPATVEELVADGAAEVVVRLSAGGVPLLARITRKSAEALALRAGCPVYAQAKSVALLA